MGHKIFGGMSKDIGIDLGTTNTLVYMSGRGIIVREPSVVAIDKLDGRVLAVGNQANEMLGRTPDNIIAIKPMKDGVIADFDITQAMIKTLIKKALGARGSFVKPRAIVCVPAGITDVERRAVEEAVIQSGAKRVYLIEEPMAAAIGAGIAAERAEGSMIVDVGGGTTEVAIISLNGIVASKSLRRAGNALDEDIVNFVRRTYNLSIGERTAEEIKLELGSAMPHEDEGFYDVKGRDLVSGLPKNVKISAAEVREAMSESLKEIAEAVRGTLESTPPELARDIIRNGIVLTGGGALIREFDTMLAGITGIPVRAAENPLDCVAEGTGRAIESREILGRSMFRNL